MKLLKNYFFRLFMIGFAFGLFGSVIYLLIEGTPFTFTPDWGLIPGYPGFTSGWWFYENLYNGSCFPAKAFGCLTNGFSYGVAFLLLGLLVRKFRKNN